MDNNWENALEKGKDKNIEFLQTLEGIMPESLYNFLIVRAYCYTNQLNLAEKIALTINAKSDSLSLATVGLFSYFKKELNTIPKESIEASNVKNNNQKWAQLAVCELYFNLGLIHDVKRILLNLIKEEPRFLPAKVLMTETLLQNGNTREASKYIEDVKKVYADEIVLNLAGIITFDQGNEKQGIKLMQQSIEYKDNGNAHYSLGSIYTFNLPNAQKAHDHFSKAYALEPQNQQFVFDFAWSCYDTNRKAQAENIFNELISISPISENYNQFLVFYILSNEIDKAKTLNSDVNRTKLAKDYEIEAFNLIIANKKELNDASKLSEIVASYDDSYGRNAGDWFCDRLEQLGYEVD